MIDKVGGRGVHTAYAIHYNLHHLTHVNREKETERGRETYKERERERNIERDREKEREREKERRRAKERGRWRERERDTETERHTATSKKLRFSLQTTFMLLLLLERLLDFSEMLLLSCCWCSGMSPFPLGSLCLLCAPPFRRCPSMHDPVTTHSLCFLCSHLATSKQLCVSLY